MTNAILRGKPDAGNPHVRFDEGEVASAKPRRGSLLYSEGLTWTLSAASYDAYYPDEEKYVAMVIGKSGKLVMTNEIEVTESGVESKL